jgi:methanogenic corrinoid protein MtbC1
MAAFLGGKMLSGSFIKTRAILCGKSDFSKRIRDKYAFTRRDYLGFFSLLFLRRAKYRADAVNLYRFIANIQLQISLLKNREFSPQIAAQLSFLSRLEKTYGTPVHIWSKYEQTVSRLNLTNLIEQVGIIGKHGQNTDKVLTRFVETVNPIMAAQESAGRIYLRNISPSLITGKQYAMISRMITTSANAAEQAKAGEIVTLPDIAKVAETAILAGTTKATETAKLTDTAKATETTKVTAAVREHIWSKYERIVSRFSLTDLIEQVGSTGKHDRNTAKVLTRFVETVNPILAAQESTGRIYLRNISPSLITGKQYAMISRMITTSAAAVEQAKAGEIVTLPDIAKVAETAILAGTTKATETAKLTDTAKATETTKVTAAVREHIWSKYERIVSRFSLTDLIQQVGSSGKHGRSTDNVLTRFVETVNPILAAQESTGRIYLRNISPSLITGKQYATISRMITTSAAAVEQAATEQAKATEIAKLTELAKVAGTTKAKDTAKLTDSAKATETTKVTGTVPEHIWSKYEQIVRRLRLTDLIEQVGSTGKHNRNTAKVLTRFVQTVNPILAAQESAGRIYLRNISPGLISDQLYTRISRLIKTSAAAVEQAKASEIAKLTELAKVAETVKVIDSAKATKTTKVTGTVREHIWSKYQQIVSRFSLTDLIEQVGSTGKYGQNINKVLTRFVQTVNPVLASQESVGRIYLRNISPGLISDKLYARISSIITTSAAAFEQAETGEIVTLPDIAKVAETAKVAGTTKATDIAKATGTVREHIWSKYQQIVRWLRLTDLIEQVGSTRKHGRNTDNVLTRFVQTVNPILAAQESAGRIYLRNISPGLISDKLYARISRIIKTSAAAVEQVKAGELAKVTETVKVMGSAKATDIIKMTDTAKVSVAVREHIWSKYEQIVSRFSLTDLIEQVGSTGKYGWNTDNVLTRFVETVNPILAAQESAGRIYLRNISPSLISDKIYARISRIITTSAAVVEQVKAGEIAKLTELAKVTNKAKAAETAKITTAVREHIHSKHEQTASRIRLTDLIEQVQGVGKYVYNVNRRHDYTQTKVNDLVQPVSNFPLYNSPPSMDYSSAVDTEKSDRESIEDNDRRIRELVKELQTVKMNMQQTVQPNIDINQYADKIYMEIEKKLKFERQRRGLI